MVPDEPWDWEYSVDTKSDSLFSARGRKPTEA